ncbi:hypothetical protein ACFFX1_28475 [Dactylosporangium sucinum]|nr:hypothetical protein [Dactylosporangium sucinum]
MSRYGPETERESSRTFVVVLLALLILTVLGALLGYILGKRDIDARESLPGDGKSPTPTSGGSAAPAAAPCPDFIGAAARKRDGNTKLPLRLVLYIRTDKKSEVWICRENDGVGLWYQGHDIREGPYPAETPVEDDNGLLLSTVTPAGDGYLATNGTTQYRVSRKELKVSGNQNFTAGVVEARP